MNGVGANGRSPSNKPVGFANPPKNQRWRIGHVQRQIKRSFVAGDGKPLTTGDLIRRAYPRLTKFDSWQYAQVRLSAERWAVRIGTAPGRHGASILWAPKPEIRRLVASALPNSSIVRNSRY